MKVSVVIPTYNEEDYLPVLLESLGSQYVKPDEVIVVDSGSTDRTVDIAKQYGCKVFNGIKNVNYNRDLGIRNAEGDIVVNTDADCILPEHYIAYAKNIMKGNVSMATGCVYPIEKMPLYYIWRASQNFVKWIQSIVAGWVTPYGCNFVVNKEKYIRVGGFYNLGNPYKEEVDLAKRLKSVGNEIFSIHLYVFTSSRKFIITEKGIVSESRMWYQEKAEGW